MVKIFDSFDTNLTFSEKVVKTNNLSITDYQEYSIDNNANLEYKPKLTITTSTSATLSNDFLVNENKNQSFGFQPDVSLTSGDTLVLDFNKQTYKKNGNSLIDSVVFSDDNLIKLLENDTNNFIFTLTGDVDIEIEYEQYENVKELHYVEGFNLDKKINYNKHKKFGELNPSSFKKNEINHSFSIEKMTPDWYLCDVIDNDDLRIIYKEYNPDTFEVIEKALVGVNIDTYKRSFQMGEFIMENVSGSAINLFTIN